MNFSKKIIIGTVLLFATAAAGIYLYSRPNIQSFDYFTYLCKIYDREGKLIQQIGRYNFCAYTKDGKTLAARNYEGVLTLFDVDLKPIWSTNEFIHHDIKFTEDEKSFLAISSEQISYFNEVVRSDCVSKRDLNNKIISEWCLSKNLETIKALGFKIEPFLIPRKNSIETANIEISHANSIYEIPENLSASKNIAFTKGNYIFNLYGPTRATLILDSSMTKVLWSIDFRKFYLDNNYFNVSTHDIQVLPNGNILVYVNYIIPAFEHVAIAQKNFLNLMNPNLGLFAKSNVENLFYSALLEFDPIKKTTVWVFKEPNRYDFYSRNNGTVDKFNKSVVYSDMTLGGKYIEISFSGKRLWTYTAQQIDTFSRRPITLAGAKPLLNIDYLKARNLID